MSSRKQAPVGVVLRLPWLIRVLRWIRCPMEAAAPLVPDQFAPSQGPACARSAPGPGSAFPCAPCAPHARPAIPIRPRARGRNSTNVPLVLFWRQQCSTGAVWPGAEDHAAGGCGVGRGGGPAGYGQRKGHNGSPARAGGYLTGALGLGGVRRCCGSLRGRRGGVIRSG